MHWQITSCAIEKFNGGIGCVGSNHEGGWGGGNKRCGKQEKKRQEVGLLRRQELEVTKFCGITPAISHACGSKCFDLMLTHVYGPVSHDLLQNMMNVWKKM